MLNSMRGVSFYNPFTFFTQGRGYKINNNSSTGHNYSKCQGRGYSQIYVIQAKGTGWIAELEPIQLKSEHVVVCTYTSTFFRVGVPLGSPHGEV